MARRKGRAGDLVRVNAVGLRALSKDLRQSDKAAAKQLTLRLREAAGPLAAAARRYASWSKRIPKSIRVTGTGANVKVVAGGKKAPHAITFEAPEGRPRAHPVYAQGPRGDWTWTRQEPRPFLRVAAEQDLDEAAEKYAEILDDVTRSFGFRPGG